MRIAFLLLLTVVTVSATAANPQDRATVARYHLKLLEGMAPRIVVRATLPSEGKELEMAQSWPADVPELADAGWPALVEQLELEDDEGRAVAFESAGPKGWTLERPVHGFLNVSYQIDYGSLMARGWPASREAAYADADHRIMVGRSLFLVTPAQRESELYFELPQSWQPVLPWPQKQDPNSRVVVSIRDDLTENLLAFTRKAPERMTADRFHLKVVTLGHWTPARSDISSILGDALRELVSLIGSKEEADYLVVLLPREERGGESFRSSFAMNLDVTPTRANLHNWAHTIAHELFHYWNGWRLVGAEYMSSQWFQEGFTEYAASLALLSAGLINTEEFCEKLAYHVKRYRQLATPLEIPGTRKGPPLYSGGALVAFVWDTLIRQATQGENGFPDLMRGLMRVTGGGARPYAWSDIQAALESVSVGEWASFRKRHILGTEPLPLEEALARVGLRISEGDDVLRIEVDPSAPEDDGPLQWSRCPHPLK
jgi:predicted metalloprotease with PDZ domain